MSNNQSVTLDGSNVVYATELIKVNETGNTTLNETIIEVAGEGNLTQQDANDSIAPLQAEIDILNNKQLQNFNGINNINTDLTNNYQTTAQLNSNFISSSTLGNYYTSSQINTTLGNYYTSTQVDTTLGNYYTSSQVDTLVAGAGGGGGYTDTEIDNLLNLRVPKSDFTDRFSTFPIIDCSAPTIIHSGLTLNNSTINISPLAGLLFSNQTGGGDKVVSQFKNATNYITLQGNKIIANATSDDSFVDLNLNPSGNVNITNDLSVGNIDLTSNLTVGGEIQLTGTNTSIERYSNATKSNVSLDLSISETASAIRLINGNNDDTDTNTFLECNNTTGGTTLFKPTNFKDIVSYESDTANISNSSGLTLYKDTTDASNVLTVKNAQGYITFNSFNINAYNTSNDSSSLLLLNTANGNGCYCLSLGIGAIAGGNKLNVAGNSNFGGTTAFQNTSTFNNNVHINSSGRLFQRADANNSLNIISTNEINFSLQNNRSTDPTTSSIALQLNDNPAGITMNRAVTNNLAFNSLGNITAEANLNVWGEILFQNSSGIKETLNGSDYDLDIRNGDTDRAINLIVGTIGSHQKFN